MEGAVVKEGFLYLQQPQTFGQKWRTFWGILREVSTSSSAQLELLEGSRPASAEKAKRAEKSRRHLICLVDCVHVAEVCGEVSCPKETTPFLLETTEKCYLLAAQKEEVASWIQGLCQQGFGKNFVNWQGMLRKDLLRSYQSSFLTMAENPLYSPTCKGDRAEFLVTVRATPASERLRLWGWFLLAVGPDTLELCDQKEGTLLYTWPYKFLRRFGHDKVLFSFEAGRRCDSGEGRFEFVTKQGSEIIRVIEEAIRVQRGSSMKDPSWAGSPNLSSGAAPLPAGAIHGQTSLDDHMQADRGPVPGQEPSLQTKLTKALSLEPFWKMMPTRASLVKAPGASSSEPLPHPPHSSKPEQRVTELSRKTPAPLAKVPAEGEYFEPFDAFSRSLGDVEGGSSNLLPRDKETPSPTSSGGRTPWSGPGPASSRPDHVYDDPEALVGPVIYDEPQECSGEAWKLQATDEDPVGYEYPYNPTLDDYSVPRMAASPVAAQGRQTWLRRDWL